jgi:alpha-1,3-rhamnosyl/mannosyltransferase
MRIAVDGRVLTDHYPGIGRAVHAVLPALAGLLERLILLKGPEPDSARFPLDQARGAGVEVFPVRWGLRTVSEQIMLSRTIRRLPVQVVLTPYFATTLHWPWPRVTMIHDLIPLTVAGAMPSRLARWLYERWIRATVRRSRAVVVPSDATAGALGRLSSDVEKKTWTVPIAVDPRFRATSRSRVDEVRRRHGLDSAYVLAVAGDRPHKNLRRLLGAWRMLTPKIREDVALAVVGSLAPDSFDAGMRALGSVTDDDLVALYGGACLVVSPSLEEGFGLPVAEAMACGAPVICSDIPVFREIAGDAAAFFDPTSSEAMSAAIRNALGDVEARRHLTELGAARARRFAPERVAAGLLASLQAATEAGT